MKRRDVRAIIEETGVLASVRVDARELAHFAAETVYAAGLPIVEITLTVPGSLDLIHELAGKYQDMAVGAGTVLDIETAERAVKAGARFLTSPGFVPEVVAHAKRADVVVFPGAMTPTEVIAAWKAGSDFVKIFPTAPVGGVQYVRSLKIPLPQVPLIVTGGVNQVTAPEYIRAGASAVGVGAELLPLEALECRQENRIHELVRRFLVKVKEARTMQEESL